MPPATTSGNPHSQPFVRRFHLLATVKHPGHDPQGNEDTGDPAAPGYVGFRAFARERHFVARSDARSST